MLKLAVQTNIVRSCISPTCFC